VTEDQDTIAARTDRFAAVLAAVSRQGIDPAGASVMMDRHGAIGIHPTAQPYQVTEAQARGILADLAPGQEVSRRELCGAGYYPSSTYQAGDVTVYAELHPDTQ
jgi:hypothetical protein